MSLVNSILSFLGVGSGPNPSGVSKVIPNNQSKQFSDSFVKGVKDATAQANQQPNTYGMPGAQGGGMDWSKLAMQGMEMSNPANGMGQLAQLQNIAQAQPVYKGPQMQQPNSYVQALLRAMHGG